MSCDNPVAPRMAPNRMKRNMYVADTESVMPKTPSVPKYMCSMMRSTL